MDARARELLSPSLAPASRGHGSRARQPCKQDCTFPGHPVCRVRTRRPPSRTQPGPLVRQLSPRILQPVFKTARSGSAISAAGSPISSRTEKNGHKRMSDRDAHSTSHAHYNKTRRISRDLEAAISGEAWPARKTIEILQRPLLHDRPFEAPFFFRMIFCVSGPSIPSSIRCFPAYATRVIVGIFCNNNLIYVRDRYAGVRARCASLY